MATSKDKVYAIIDIETTGGKAIRDRITEIAIVLYDGHQIIDRFETLINPECYIPYGITELTGITQDMVADAPKFYEVGKKIVEMTQSTIFVAHNVRFDYSFIREEFKRLGFTFSRRQLCTVRLSRKAFPGLSSYSLGALITHFDIEVSDRHRAMADALATTQLLDMILQNESNQENVKELVNLGIKESLLPNHWTIDTIHQLPDQCGVYYFLDRMGMPLYVGKSKNIRNRIATHFSNKTDKARNLQNHAFEITYELTGSELVALILESHEIKRLNPPINRAQRLRSFPIAIHYFYNQHGYLCFDIARVNNKTKKQYQILAEYPKLGGAKGHLTRYMNDYELCPQLCGLEKGSGACFNYHLRKCAGSCIQLESPETYNEKAEAVKELLSTVFEEDFILLDKGREPEEYSAIFVKSGICLGYSYVSAEEIDEGLDLDAGVQVKVTSTPEMIKIIRRYMASNSKLKTIQFS